jgi:hypothetical protein
MQDLNIQQELRFIHREKTKISEKESVNFELLNIAGVLLANYVTAKTKRMKNFYSGVYSKTKYFYLRRI